MASDVNSLIDKLSAAQNAGGDTLYVNEAGEFRTAEKSFWSWLSMRFSRMMRRMAACRCSFMRCPVPKRGAQVGAVPRTADAVRARGPGISVGRGRPALRCLAPGRPAGWWR